VGLGRSAVLTTDVNGRWSRGWLQWPGFTSLVGQMGAWLARGIQSEGVRVAASAAQGRLRIDVDATLGEDVWDTGLDLTARIVGPSGEALEPVVLEARGAGHYQADVQAPRAGAYLVTVVRGDGTVIAATGAESSSGAEVTAEGGNRALLEEIASRSGGKVRADLEHLFEERGSLRHASLPIHRELAWLAIVLVLLTVAVRRLPAPPVGVWFSRIVTWFQRDKGELSAKETTVVVASDALEKIRSRRKEEKQANAPNVPIVPRVEVRETSESEVVGAMEVTENQPEEKVRGEQQAVAKSIGEKESTTGGLDSLVAKKRARKR
jgi:hypothetical protein